MLESIIFLSEIFPNFFMLFRNFLIFTASFLRYFPCRLRQFSSRQFACLRQFALRRSIFAVWFLAAALLTSGCSYKIEIQQGDEFLTRQLGGLEIGMTQPEVTELLGQPNLPRLFRPNIWLYGYQIREAGFEDDAKLLMVELHFDEAGLVSDIQIRGDEIVKE